MSISNTDLLNRLLEAHIQIGRLEQREIHLCQRMEEMRADFQEQKDALVDKRLPQASTLPTAPAIALAQTLQFPEVNLEILVVLARGIIAKEVHDGYKSIHALNKIEMIKALRNLCTQNKFACPGLKDSKEAVEKALEMHINYDIPF